MQIFFFMLYQEEISASSLRQLFIPTMSEFDLFISPFFLCKIIYLKKNKKKSSPAVFQWSPPYLAVPKVFLELSRSF